MRHAQPRIASSRTPIQNQWTQGVRQRLAIQIALKVIVRCTGDKYRSAPVLVRTRHAWILEQLMPQNHPPADQARELAYQMPREFVRTGMVQRIGIVNADVDHRGAR